MRCCLQASLLLLHPDDVPHYKKRGGIVRNTYFWALRSIADEARFDQPWTYDQQVWVALERMLQSFAPLAIWATLRQS